MKRYGALFLTVLMVWSLAIPAIAADSPFPDVPVDHWAYDSIAKLSAAGLVIGYPDGTFGGKRTMTRYEMAMVFARILDRLEIWIDNQFAAVGDELEADIYGKVTGDVMAQIDDLKAAIADIPEQTVVERIVEKPVRQVVETTVVEKPFELTDETKAVLADFIAQELVDEVAWLVEHETRLAELDNSVAATTADLERTQAAVSALEGDVEAVRGYIESQVESIGAELAALSVEFENELEVIGVRVDNLENVFAELDDRVVALEKATDDNRKKIAETSEQVSALADDVADLKAVTDKMYYENLGQDADIAGLDARVQNLELGSTQVSAISAEVADLREKLNNLRFGGSLEVEYVNNAYDTVNNKTFDSLTYTLNLDATMPTEVATIKAAASVSAESLADNAGDAVLDLAVAAEDIDIIGMNGYLELANDKINTDSNRVAFNFGLAKDFTLMGLPATFAVDESIELTDGDKDTTDFTLTFNKFLIDNLSASVGYGFENGKQDDTASWSTGFDLGIGASTLSLDWEQNDAKRTTDVSFVVPVIEDIVDWTIGGGIVVDRADDTDEFNFNTGVEVKF